MNMRLLLIFLGFLISALLLVNIGNKPSIIPLRWTWITKQHNTTEPKRLFIPTTLLKPEQSFFSLLLQRISTGSEMAIRLKNAADKNRRFKVDIDSLKPKQQGFLKVINLTQDGVPLSPEESETILEVPLAKPLASGESTTFSLEFQGQVPDVIRRAGKNSKEGIAFSMAQWYPKMAEYDYEGWNADPYTGREFHGVWGDFDVKITLDKAFTVAASGYLQNADDIGRGYSNRKKAKTKKGKSLGIMLPQMCMISHGLLILSTFMIPTLGRTM